MNAPTKPPRADVEVLTLGCRLNAYESEAMRALASEAALSNAVIVNTCAVTGEAVRQARQTIRRARRERPDAEIIVTGCAAQIDPQSFAAMPEVSRVIGNAEKMRRGSFERNQERVCVSDIMSVRETASHLIDGFSERTRAYIQVQNGCDHRCTFCIIPYGRGNSRSAAAGDVVEQVRRLADNGVPEVVLTGVDLTSWGADLPGQPQLGALVARILKLVPQLPMLRLSSLDAIEMDDQLFEQVTQNQRVAPYLHLSLQHGDDLILKRMKRRHSRAQAIELCQRVKAARPEIALGADLIAGFPTETEAHVTNLISIVEECGLAYVHAFPFSAREGTPAARMPQVDRRVVKARAARLRDVATSALKRHLDNWLGRQATGIVERDGFARLPDFTPVRFTGGGDGFQHFNFTGHDGQHLIGAPV
ncbi:tRNA (N(6)-L-threonylcarbamoyladenosine(37)-C(2))-methylthiotransferase MtaB [Candidatus Viadribacter manganicus]|uniref:tRNA (N(6)-L-threonylcarbamoyladenosine(37)-C(2))-methylthiotransferase MtaB n=1 Tax=Candidatus Viadribacter manganicus TaxID=1759059 RepID=A0A1B1ADQ6_9PROT|nr:tRNA (N(6)-L-threonylcarbamoyladenosine(37)-C(2))-methylthiotransferase MtaB [Candidatus Viadribacter manganicus]ANP44685.1 tRNA (N(6)-L-threonylcarbamoyladenosine(37)-C(2))-methylthiotransferase MtaB [Candidatus Viadribacter manganicus]